MKVKLIKDSIANHIRICTFILEYPRFVHSEFMTHRLFSRNSASSRAIPTKAIIAQLRNDPADIVWWGKQMTGMQAKEELSGIQLKLAKFMWKLSMNIVIGLVHLLSMTGLHKQLTNRMLETFQNIRVVVTATEWNNFFALRDHPDAQPEIAALAAAMKEAMNFSVPTELQPNEWHIPYLLSFKDDSGKIHYYTEESIPLTYTLETALKISASLAAQESYRKSDPTLEKAEFIWDKLVSSAPVHASPTEHQAQAMEIPTTYYVNSYGASASENTLSILKTNGITHLDKYGSYWSGNLRGWIQHRQLIPNHHVPG